jgi:ATP-binding cassette subfamily B (MDR/TAP) protein 1
MDHIKGLKEQLEHSFSMKDLGAAKQILGMKICRDRKNRKLTLSQADYIEKVLQHFSMENAKAVSTPLPSHLKLSKEMCPKTQEEEAKMSKVPYSSAVGSLMYAMVCTRPDIAHAVGVVSRYMSHPSIQHWNVVKWILRYLRGTSSQCLHFGGSTTDL